LAKTQNASFVSSETAIGGFGNEKDKTKPA
jgi:hypothetical protein